MEYPILFKDLHCGKPFGEFPNLYCVKKINKKPPAPTTAMYMQQAAERAGLMIIRKYINRPGV